MGNNENKDLFIDSIENFVKKIIVFCNIYIALNEERKNYIQIM